MKKLLQILACISIYTANAQNGFTTYTTNLNINTSINKQSAFLLDNSGNKWIGFNGSGIGANVGLVKFDNTIWTLFNTTSSPALPSNNITSLVQDSIGNLWIGTDSGLVKYNGNQFTKYTIADGLPTNYITSIDAIGNIVYIGTLKGVSRFNGISFVNYNMANSNLANDSVFTVKMQSKSLVWLGGNNRLMRHTNVSSISIFGDYPITNSGVTNCIAIDSQGKNG